MNKSVKPILFIVGFLLVVALAHSQTATISLDTCLARAQAQYPLVRQYDLLSISTQYAVENAAKGYLPQISLQAQATYQSDVTQLPIQAPGVTALSKDQYKVYLDVNQPLYEGGVIKRQQEIQRANAAVEAEKVTVELYKLRERVQQVFFGVLLLEEQLRQNDLLQNDIQLGIRKTTAAVEHGTAFKSNLDLLQAERLKVQQRNIELQATRRAYRDMLSLLTGLTFGDNTLLAIPPRQDLSASINRPELRLFDTQRNALDLQHKLLKAKNMPRLNLFAQGGFGRPAFNILSNDFEAYYIGGIRLNVPISGYYTLKNERNLLHINKKQLDVQQDVFLFNTDYSLRQQNAEVQKLLDLLVVDQEIVALRQSVKTTAAVQLENGVITSSDYLREVNAEDGARQAKIVHDIQLLLAQYTQKHTSGN
jgi:outer membrane protein TolC